MDVKDAETGDVFRLRATGAFIADLAAFRRAECKHSTTTVRSAIISGGAIQYRNQCSVCGELKGSAIARSRVTNEPEAIDLTLRERFVAGREADYQALIRKHIKLQKEAASGFWQRYDEYLLSEKWKQKRQRVMLRADGQCEGCGEKPATEVHHLTYANCFDEFLFELAAVCHTCHIRYHKQREERLLRPGAEESCLEIGDLPCDGCRYFLETGSNGECVAYDMDVRVALSPSGPCGPDAKTFKPLR